MFSKDLLSLYSKIIFTAIGIPLISVYLSYSILHLLFSSQTQTDKKVNRTFSSGIYHILAPVHTYLVPHIAVNIIIAVCFLLYGSDVYFLAAILILAVPFMGSVVLIIKNNRMFLRSGFSYIPVAIVYVAVFVIFTLIRLVIL